MDQLVLVAVIALISFVHWVIKKSMEARERRKTIEQSADHDEFVQERRRVEPPQAAPSPAEDPEASMRRLMEALGLPVDAEPPPVPRRAPDPPAPEPEAPPPIPASVFVPPPLPAPPAEVPVLKARPERPVLASLAPRGAAGRPAASASGPKMPAPEPVPSPLRSLLATPDGLRRAVVLSEILGPPRSLKAD